MPLSFTMECKVGLTLKKKVLNISICLLFPPLPVPYTTHQFLSLSIVFTSQQPLQIAGLMPITESFLFAFDTLLLLLLLYIIVIIIIFALWFPDCSTA
ncbi:uncharacterized protein TEOVI_000194100 [Trypanosoma equiperdum]|uniref:Uncharacterized protein n=2 Tax=Trypanozoon TaxID=39700 RepID=Q38D49_TRYB2|nr:hypothetical protein, unlikely [Trypanosoma brucei brucei TREU927]EAN77271.1 hypothetical protein, unlikely [Trypanosoma brucei brucei TREU927]SCU70368.1 hypothetical protein, conserved [Trypanosoma equiperdum]